jgi:CO/xanthine dehydrogenase Mo-binding subunit
MRLRPIGPNHGATPGRCGYWRRHIDGPRLWSSIARDGIVTVNVGKADTGQHVASTIAQIVADELGAPWNAMRVGLVGNDPKYNDTLLSADITGSGRR